MTHRRADNLLAAGLGCAGLVCVVVGTFLPWLYSGSRTRNSYATSGAVRRLLGVDGVGAAALAAWPFVGVACGAAIAALLVGLRRIAALIGLVAAATAATGAVAMLRAGDNGVFRPANVGPIVTLVGSLIVPAAVMIHMFLYLDLTGDDGDQPVATG
jgi:hypothetical protein